MSYKKLTTYYLDSLVLKKGLIDHISFYFLHILPNEEGFSKPEQLRKNPEKS